MKTSPGRALVPAIGAALAAPFVLVITTLISEAVGEDRTTSLGGAGRLWFVQGLSPLGWTGVVADVDVRGERILAILVGLVVLVLVVFAVTWLTASSLAAGSWALPVFVGGWLGTTVGGALAGLTAALVDHRTVNDIRNGPAVWYFAHFDFMNGLKWGLLAGVLVGLLAVVLWLARRPRPTPYVGQATPGSGTDPAVVRAQDEDDADNRTD